MPDRTPVHTIPSDEIPERGQVLFTFTDSEGHEVQAFCVRCAGRVYAYVNSCPHWRVGLDLDDGQVWDTARRYLECRNHGALFRAEDGYCESGPCFGGSLLAVPLEESAGEIRLYLPVFPDADLLQ